MRSIARNEARKRWASERRYVGSCNELGGGVFTGAPNTELAEVVRQGTDRTSLRGEDAGRPLHEDNRLCISCQIGMGRDHFYRRACSASEDDDASRVPPTTYRMDSLDRGLHTERLSNRNGLAVGLCR